MIGRAYDYFSKKRFAFIALLFAIIGFIAFFLSRIEFKEDIRAIIPQDGRIDDINLVLNNSKFSDQIILNFSMADTSMQLPDSVKACAEDLVSVLQQDTTYIKKITFKIEESSFQDVYSFFYSYLPYYLTPEDYAFFSSHFTNENIESTLKKDLQSLISPAGIATKKYIFQDPFSLTPHALKKLQSFNLDENFSIHKSCIFTKDQKNLLVFIEPINPSSNTQENKFLIDSLEYHIAQIQKIHPSVSVEYYGGTAVAVANAHRIKADIQLTVSIVFVIIFIIFYFFFRKIRILFLLFFPVLIGAGLAISVISILSGSISAIALGVGAILVGVSIDYSLHAFTHFRSSGSVKQSIKDIALPLIMSSLTTASAFLCLFIIKSEALNQLGMFGAFSVVFAALTVLFILPQFLTKTSFSKHKTTGNTIFDKIAAYGIDKNKYVLWGILILTIVFCFTFYKISFNSDIASMNYLPKHLAQAEKNLQEISSETQSAVYLVTTGNSLNEALVKSEAMQKTLAIAKEQGLFATMSSASDLILSTEKQEQQITLWSNFWDSIGRDSLQTKIIEKGSVLRFKEHAFSKFYNLIQKDFKPVELDEFELLQNQFLQNYIQEKDGVYSVISIVKVSHENKPAFFDLFEGNKDVIIFDKQYFSNKFFDILKEDFDKLVYLSFILVFIILLLSFGRIELAIITMIPILLSWLWTLGLMGLFGIQFNIFNIIISTFIFGLGIDYSIFIMQGLLNNYSYGNHSLTPYKLSVLLSVLTTILGIGVLIFAKHPALKSIALVSIFGIASVVIISYTILPLLFSIVTTQKGKTRKEPITLTNGAISIISFIVFLLVTIVLTICIPILYVLPIPRKSTKYIFHVMVTIASRIVVGINITFKKTYIDKHKLDFSKPSVIVSNHQSHLDLVLMLMLNPKMIVMTNKWVWYNPFYGFVVRFADYFPIYRGIDKGFEKIRKKVAEGYSILIFPEGSRTIDGSIGRYHQGALKLADDLGLEVQPVLIHGAFECLPKTEFFLRSGNITLQFLDRITVKTADLENNETYKDQAKALTKLVRTTYAELRESHENTDFYKQHVKNQYIFKGPILEWYVKVKMRMENNYAFINSVVPTKASIVNIGCGYGYLDYMLRCVSKDRTILGLDYDEKKISIAQKIAEFDSELNFEVRDITTQEIPNAQVYILLDVLHYLPEELQMQTLNTCLAKLPNGGIIIVRDADADLESRTNVTKSTEIKSTKIFKFNKTKFELTYISGTKIMDVAKNYGYSCERFDLSKRTSNITYVIRNEE